MHNWIGQSIGVGDTVYRGARYGNSSEFKIGIVEEAVDGKKPRVRWLYREFRGVPMRISGSGSPDPNSLVVIPHKALEVVQARWSKAAAELPPDVSDYTIASYIETNML